MKTKELMIGDWVYGTKMKRYGRIDRLEHDVEDESVEPIPLTEEILKKNGFKEYVYTSLHTFYYDKKPIVSLFGNFGFSIDINRQNIKIHYVHELQHALKLCRIDKEIEL